MRAGAAHTPGGIAGYPRGYRRRPFITAPLPFITGAACRLLPAPPGPPLAGGLGPRRAGKIPLN